MPSLSPAYTVDPELLSQLISLNTTLGPMEYGFPDLDTYVNSTLTYGVIFGVRLGAFCWTIVSQLLYSSTYKSTMFLVTMASLVLALIQTILFLVYIYSPFRELATHFTGSYASLTVTDVNVSVAASVFEVMSVISIMASLIIQVRSIFSDSPILNWVVTIIVVGGACIPTAMIWTWALVINAKLTIDPEYAAVLTIVPWVLSATDPSFAATIVLVSFVLISKLLYAIIRRKQLGLTQFDSTQIFFISFAQTMVLPAVFTIMDFALPESIPTGFSAFTTMLVIISLPMTGVWAKFKVISPHPYQKRMLPYYGTTIPAVKSQPSPTFTNTTRSFSTKELIDSSIQGMENHESIGLNTPETARPPRDVTYDEFINRHA